MPTTPSTFDSDRYRRRPGRIVRFRTPCGTRFTRVVLEREKFPRYHIGESLLPFTCFPLKRLGPVGENAPIGFRQKIQRSIRFAFRAKPRSRSIFPLVTNRTWRRPGRCCVRSSIRCCMENARAKGAEVRRGNHRATELIQEEGRDASGSGRARKSGATLRIPGADDAGLLGRGSVRPPTRLNWRIRDPKLNKVAVWTYYRGALSAMRGLMKAPPPSRTSRRKGWFWYIPQHNDMISVGVVAEGKYLTRERRARAEGYFQPRDRAEPVDQGPPGCGTPGG